MSSCLDVELLGEPVRGRSFYECVLGPGTAGDGWSAYCLYRDHIVRRDPWTIYEIDLQTREVTPYHGQMCDTWFLFAMPDGCIYTFPEDTDDPTGPKAYVARLNTKTAQIEVFGPGSSDSWNYCVCWGPDDAMYIGGWRLHRAMRFDPETGEFIDYGVQGPECTGGIYDIACCGRYLYTTMGGDPFYLVAMDLRTREQEVLLRLPRPQRLSLEQRPEAVFVEMQSQADLLADVERGRWYRLENKLLEEDAAASLTEAEVAPSCTTASKPDLLSESPECRADGTAVLWFRPPSGEWESVAFLAGQSSSYLFRLGTFGDGKLVGASEDPYHLFQYDPWGEPGAERFTVLGPSCGVHVYAFQGYGGKGYFVGYCGSPVLEYDPSRPWTAQYPNPVEKPPDWKSPDANPRLVASIPGQRRAYDVVLGADERLYVPCSAELTRWPGGMLGWYDPQTGEAGGVREGFEMSRGVDAEPACDGRHIVCTTAPWPVRGSEEDATLVTYDTAEQRVVGQQPIARGCGEESRIVEWREGRILGYVRHPSEAHFVFYLFDVACQKLTVGLDYPGNVHGRLLRLPNGAVGFLDGKAVHQLDPETWQAVLLGELDRPPRDWALLGEELYLILDTYLARVRAFGVGAETAGV